MAKTELVAGLGFGAAVGVALGALVIAPNLTTGMADDDPETTAVGDMGKRLGLLGFRAVGVTTARIGIASVLGGAAAWAAVRLCEHRFGTAHGGEAIALVAGAVIGLIVMVAIAVRLRIPEVESLRSSLRRG